MVNFPTRIPDCDFRSSAFLDLFISSDASICSTMTFPPLSNSDHVVVSVSIDFPSNSQQMPCFIAKCMTILMLIGTIFMIIYLRDVSWESLISSAFAAAIEFYKWVQGPSPWFSATFAAVMVYRTHFFCLYQRNKSSESKVKVRQVGNCCKRVLEAAKLAYAPKTKESITSQKLGSQDFWQIADSVLNKGKSVIPPLLNGLEVLSSTSDKVKSFPKNFSKNSNLVESGISLPVFPSRTNLKLQDISVTLKMVKKVMSNLDLSKASSPSSGDSKEM